MIVAAVATGVVLLAAGAWIVMYNRFVRQRQLIENSWSTVDTELRRRYDLVPNLVATVKGYAAHERATLAEVVAARRRAQGERGPVDDQAAAENDLVHALQHLFAVSEAYPELQASHHFLQLQHQLVVTEDRIQAARRIFNGNVRDYNARVEQVPTNLVARLSGFGREAYFEVDEAVRQAEVTLPLAG